MKQPTPSQIKSARQRETILAAESALGVGPVALAKLMNTPYSTLRYWKSEKSVMPGAAYVTIRLLIKTMR